MSYFLNDTTHDLGPTSTTGLYAGIDPPAGGYVIYQIGGPSGVNARVAANDAEAIKIYKGIGATGTTISDVLSWASGQSSYFTTTGATPVTVGQSTLGGVVAYILQSGDTGYNASVQHGFVVYNGSVPYATGGGNGTYVTTAREIGTGQANTNAIIAAGGSVSGNPVYIADNLVAGGYSDWYLPSWDELRQLYNNRGSLGIPTNVTYYSSTDYSTGYWRGINFAFGTDSLVNKGITGGVAVAIRSF